MSPSDGAQLPRRALTLTIKKDECQKNRTVSQVNQQAARWPAPRLAPLAVRGLLRICPENLDFALGLVALVRFHQPQPLHDPHAAAHPPKDGVLAVQPGRGCQCQEELRRVREKPPLAPSIRWHTAQQRRAPGFRWCWRQSWPWTARPRPCVSAPATHVVSMHLSHGCSGRVPALSRPRTSRRRCSRPPAPCPSGLRPVRVLSRENHSAVVLPRRGRDPGRRA